MFTPQEVSDKVFPRATGFSGGYQMSAVDEFLDALTEDYTSLYKENVTLKAKLKVLAEKVEEYRVTEDSMRATLLTAQRMADKMVKEAEAQRDTIVAKARHDAADEIAKLDAETEVYRRRLVQAQDNLTRFIAQSRGVIAQQEAYLSQLPQTTATEATAAGKMAATPPTPAAPTIETPLIEPTPVVDFVPEEAPAVEAAPAAEEKESFPSDFKLSLDELKFGRNYGTDK
ncbi:MAG: DivIVA domain-containing protein [Oscillospiraceae bacterium]|nr:DivIVA domain-containing protein [Oscillospiraceae bacterium]MBQ6974236.1 DivIVA domain-containing protein [Oscillospiraceae bacterium]